MHKKIFLKIIIIILFVNLSYSSSNNFFQKMHEGTYIPILLPDNNYRWDQWQFSINTESNDLILQNGFILNNDEIIYDEELNINGEFEPGTPPPNVEGINTGLLPKTGDVTVPDKWSFSTSGTGNKGYDNQTYTISFNITSEPLHTTAWTSDYFPINNSQTYTLVFEVKTNETDPFVYAQFRNAANNGYITSGIFTGSTEWEKKYVTFTNTDNHQTKVILKSFNNGPIYMEFRNISFYEGNYVSDDLPENWTVSKDVNVTQTLENGIFSFNLPSIKSASIRYTYYNLSAGDYLFSAETNGSVETMYVQTQEVGEVGYIVSNQFYLDENEYIPTQAYLSLNESKNITFYLKVNSLQGNVSFKNASLKKIGEIEELGWEFTNGYRLYVAQVSENVCNGFDYWCGGGHGGDINIVKNFSHLNKNFIQYKRTATNPLFNSTIYYTYDIDNFKVYENYNFEFNQSANLSLLNDDYFYVGMQTVRNVKVTNELWKNGINIYNHSLISEGGEPQSYEEGTIHVLRSNNSLESNNYSYVYRSNVFDERISLQSTTYGYNKKYFVLKDKDIKYPNWQTEGINVYVHWDTIKGAEIPETLLNDTWAPDVILFSDGNYTNLNSNPDKQIQINKEDNKITIYSNDEVNIELREYNTAYVDGEENTNYRIYDAENNTNITNVLKNEIIYPLNQTYNTKNILLEINSTGDNVWYNWNGTNYTYENPILIEFNHGENTIEVWTNNSLGDENYTNVTFTVYNPFITVWNTELNSTIKLPLIDSADDPTSEYNFYVDWGDGNVSLITEWNSVNATHDYGTNDTYTIQMYGLIKGINFAYSSNNNSRSILEIQQWGDINLGNYGSYFTGCENLKITATDILNLTGTTNLEEMFGDTGIETVPNMNLWDVSQVTNMQSMFYNAYLFNENISDWDTSNVTDMSGMFESAGAFNQSLSDWNTSSVTTMNSMFMGAESFNQPLNNWNTSQVIDMSGMFFYTMFNQSLNNWDVSNVENMEMMFAWSPFNQPINNWNMSKVNSTYGMFALSAFNQPLDNWDVSNVKNMEAMFMFTMFNQSLNNWNVSSVTEMGGMFMFAQGFNQSLDTWDMPNVNGTSQMFSYAIIFNQPLDTWDVSKVTDMSGMFEGASAFDQELGMWNISSVIDMDYIFDGVTLSQINYDNTIIGWENQTPNIPSNVTLGYVYSYYCASVEARSELIRNYNWTFSDLGKCGTPSSGSSRNKEYPRFEYEWDCETGILEIESESNIEIRLMSLRDFSTYKNTTNNNGIVSFTLAREGTYRIFTESTSDYYSLQKDITFEFCEEEIGGDKENQNGFGVGLNETDNVNDGEEELNVSIDTTLHDKIEKLLSETEPTLSNSEAINKLNEAKEAFNRGEYELAEQLINQAIEIEMNAQSEKPIIDESKEGTGEEIIEPLEEKGFDFSLCLIGLVLFILVVIGWKFLIK